MEIINNSTAMTNNTPLPALSICIATYNRGRFISETLDSILEQIELGVEVVIVDGASPDNTAEVMAQYVSNYPQINYFCEEVNSGVDADFDKAVGYAKGEYCWLMTDDDLLKPNAIRSVLSCLNSSDDLIIVNSEVKNIDLTAVFEARRLKFNEDRVYRKADRETFFSDTAAYLSFIGCVVIRRKCWLSRNRADYYGTLFIHVGVIFQNPPIENVKVISQPLITIRYGNAMWTPRSFEIWLFKWPKLIWSFPEFSDTVKRKICRRKPWMSAKALFHNRALGAYSISEYRRFCSDRKGIIGRLFAYMLSIFPSSLANFIMIFYFSLKKSSAQMALHDLLHSLNASRASHLLAQIFGVKK